MFSRGESGFTLLETLLALTVTMFVLAAAMRLLSFASASAARAVVRGELTDSARAAADVMTVNIERATDIKIVTVGNNTLKSMSLTQANKIFVFTYDITASPSDPGYHRLIFSGEGGTNELASNIAEIRVFKDGPDALVIQIKTDDKVTVNADSASKRAKVSVDPINIQIPINITGKAVIP